MALANARIHRGDTQGSLKNLLNAGATVFRLPINKKTFAAPKVPQRSLHGAIVFWQRWLRVRRSHKWVSRLIFSARPP